MSDSWDCIVVGAGVVGLWTAYHLAKDGKKPLVIDQFTLPHTRGSSSGQSRKLSMADQNPENTRLMPESLKLWLQLEKESGKTLYRNTGLLVIGSCEADITGVKASMKQCNLPFEELTGVEIQQKYPQLNYPKSFEGLWDPDAGLLLSNRCIAVLKHLIVKHGGTFHDAEPVKEIHPGPEVTVVTPKGHYMAKKVVITPGAWANDILKDIGLNLPLKVSPAKMLYWRDTSKKAFDVEQGMPVVIYREKVHGNEYRAYLMFPCFEYSNQVKVLVKCDTLMIPAHPDDRDIQEKPGDVAVVSQFISKHLPGVATTPSIVEPCITSATPDETCIIDYHPQFSNIMVGCGMGGIGFKSAPVLGKLLMEMATEKPPSYNLQPFCIARFHQGSQ